MESSRPSQVEARLALEAADAARHRVVDELTLPPGFLASIGAAVAVQIASAAIAFAADVSIGSIALLVGGVVLLLVVGLAQAWRFRRQHGVWLGGLLDYVVFGTNVIASTTYTVGLLGALIAATQGLWGLVAVAAVLGGAGYAIGGQRWLGRYRANPETHARGLSPTLMLASGGIAMVGLVLLLVLSR